MAPDEVSLPSDVPSLMAVRFLLFISSPLSQTNISYSAAHIFRLPPLLLSLLHRRHFSFPCVCVSSRAFFLSILHLTSPVLLLLPLYVSRHTVSAIATLLFSPPTPFSSLLFCSHSRPLPSFSSLLFPPCFLPHSFSYRNTTLPLSSYFLLLSPLLFPFSSSPLLLFAAFPSKCFLSQSFSCRHLYCSSYSSLSPASFSAFQLLFFLLFLFLRLLKLLLSPI